ncbi:multidrug effflux MFS transporter [Nocardioides panacis]|uniref:Multidrug effflux MFS transporter n=1 Tax=Nocardioides panacis TaxID=2849501 RepID=A0A975SX63_9ACTN|nr:multidrug effflux MFS transporter [Nocardioides panacis]QWZ07585.1 multidrug effflux MFS transporter [Nocardioides panacis]
MTATAPTRPARESPTGRRYVQLVLVLGALIALGPLTIDMYLPAFPRIGDDLGASDSAVQLTLTGMLLGLAVGQLVIGPLSDAFGRRRPLMVGIATHAVASLACAVAPTIGVLATVRVVQGFAGAAISVVAMATVRDLFEGVAVARIMSRLMLVIGLAPILAPTIGGFVLTFTSWRGIFVVLAAAAVLLVGVAFLFLRETLPVDRRRPAGVRSSLAAYRELLRDRVFVALAVIGGSMMAAIFAYVSGAPFVLQDGFGLDTRTFGLVFGLNAAGLTLTSQVNPVLLRWFTVRQVLGGAIVGAGLAAAVLLTVGLTGAGGLVAVLVPLAVLVSTAGLALPNVPALALTRHGEAAGTAAAVLGCVQFGVGAVVAPLVGAFGSTTAAPMGAAMLAVTLLAGVLMFGVVRRERNPPRF